MPDNISQEFLIQSYEVGMEDAPCTSAQVWVFILEERYQLSEMVPYIQDSTYIPQVNEDMDRKGILSQEEFERLYQDATRKTMEMLSDLYLIWDINQVAGFYDSGNMIKIWGLWQEEGCPLCNKLPQENHRHLLHCENPKCPRMRKY